ncbi:MAG: hypothetical protein JWM89_568 [Acidimicrobiales bacterium]|nr:hypothetical protein [Acidimicrobiales bacterium]
MAACNYCSQEMLDGISYSVEVLHRDGAPFPLKPFGKDRQGRYKRPDGRCGDCGVPVGGFHHLGCDVQRCPCCRHQMISCGCWFDEDGVSIAEDEEMFESFVAHHWHDYAGEAS